MLQFYATPEIEAAAVARAAARASCPVRSLEVHRASSAGPWRLVGSLSCVDGWMAAALLLALAEEDSRTEGARRLAWSLRLTAPDDAAFARAVHAFVRGRVRFAPEAGEVFQSGALTLALGVGDCDDHFRLAYALAVAGGIGAKLGILHHGEGYDVPEDKRGPAHAAAILSPNGVDAWAETTIAAHYGEDPNAAARRLGLTRARSDIAKEVVIMTADDLGPMPDGYETRNAPERVLLDASALVRLGFLAASSSSVADAAAPGLRAAVLAFQSQAGLTPDGVLGPRTRAALLEALQDSSASVVDGLSYPGLGEIGAAVPVLHSSDVSDDFLRELVAMARRFRVRGSRATAEDWARVWTAESGLSSHRAHGPAAAPSGLPFGGLNQMGPHEREAVGFLGSFAEWLALDNLDQLPFVERYYSLKPVHLIHDARSAYVATFAPAYLPAAKDAAAVLYAYRYVPGMPAVSADAATWAAYAKLNRSDPYTQNRGYDWARKGTITVGDLTVAIDRVGGERWKEIAARLRALGGGGSGMSPGRAVAGALGLLVVVGSGVASWWAASS